MELLISLLLGLQLAEPTAAARIVGRPDSPVTLIGNACASESEPRVIAAPVPAKGRSAEDVVFGLFQSPAFQCGDRCSFAWEVVATRPVAGFRLGLIMLGDSGHYYSGLMPELPVLSSTSCDGKPASSVSAKSPLISEGLLLYVAEVRFADGSEWRLPAHEFVHQVMNAWHRRGLRLGR